MASGPITSWQIDGETMADFIFWGSKITADGDCSHEIKRHLLLGRKDMTNLDSIFKRKKLYFVNKGPSSQGYGFSSSHVWMWELNYKAEHRRINAFELWCWRRLLRVPWTAMRSNQSILTKDQSWVFIGGTDVEAETPILWPPDAKSWLIWKHPDAGKDWGQEEKGTTQAEMVGWHHRHNGHEFRWTLGVGDGQGGLACCGSWEPDSSSPVPANNMCHQKFHSADSKSVKAVPPY